MKPAELKQMTLAEIKSKESELQKELFNLRMRHVTSQIENPLRLRALRKDIARVKTAITGMEKKALPSSGARQ
ncbi:MAG: 50S ribosomal protein L29 [Deltaproteobacteria bacterium]|nr:50S ribosomal protein L29 [Deltaproteobacteria bacterium]